MREALGIVVVAIALCLLLEPEKTAQTIGSAWHTFMAAAYPPTCANPH